MTKLNFNVPLKNIRGEEEKSTLAATLSELIATQTEGKTLKLFGWHKELQVGNELVLDDTDLEDLQKLIEGDKRFFVFVKGQLIEIIKESKK